MTPILAGFEDFPERGGQRRLDEKKRNDRDAQIHGVSVERCVLLSSVFVHPNNQSIRRGTFPPEPCRLQSAPLLRPQSVHTKASQRTPSAICRRPFVRSNHRLNVSNSYLYFRIFETMLQKKAGGKPTGSTLLWIEFNR